MPEASRLTRPVGVTFHRRSQMALDALSPSERAKVIDRVRLLEDRSVGDLARANAVKLNWREPMYVMRASPATRIIYRMVGDVVEVLDIVHKDTLDTFAKRYAVPVPSAHEKRQARLKKLRVQQRRRLARKNHKLDSR